MFKNFNNVFAIMNILLLFTMWMLQGFGIISIPEIILGVLTGTHTMIITFYFRKKETSDPPA